MKGEVIRVIADCVGSGSYFLEILRDAILHSFIYLNQAALSYFRDSIMF